MVLESLTKDTMNIKKLVLEEPVKRENLLIGPNIELTKDDWEKMKQILSRQTGWLGYINMAKKMKILYPEKEEDLRLDQQLWQGHAESLTMFIKQYEQYPQDSTAYAQAIGILADLAILFPERRNEIKEAHEDLKKKAKTAWYDMSSPNLHGVPGYPANLAIIDQNDLHSYPRLEFLRDGWLENLENEQAEMLETPRRGILPFADSAAEFRLTFPNYPLNIDSKMWGLMKEYLNQMGEDPYQYGGEDFYFPWIAYCIKILAAEKINITDQGIELIMLQDRQFTENIPLLPEKRKF